MCATGEPAVLYGSAGDGCDDADDDGSSKRVVRGEPESGWMRVFPERDYDHLPGIPNGDGDPATTAGQDGNDGGDAGLRHERGRDAGSGDCADERDPGELRPPAGDDPGKCELWTKLDDGLPGRLLRRRGDDRRDDDLHGRGQQRVRSVHTNDDMFVEPWNESAGRDIGDAVERAVRDLARRADHGSVFPVHAS